MRHALILLIVIILISACAPTPAVPSVEVEMTAPAPESEFRIVGYATAAVIVDTVQFDQLTHINYAFLIPNEDGTFASLPNAWKLEQLVARAHENGVQVLISVGGWGWDDQFEALAASPERRGNLCPRAYRVSPAVQPGWGGYRLGIPRPGRSWRKTSWR